MSFASSVANAVDALFASGFEPIDDYRGAGMNDTSVIDLAGADEREQQAWFESPDYFGDHHLALQLEGDDASFYSPHAFMESDTSYVQEESPFHVEDSSPVEERATEELAPLRSSSRSTKTTLRQRQEQAALTLGAPTRKTKKTMTPEQKRRNSQRVTARQKEKWEITKRTETLSQKEARLAKRRAAAKKFKTERESPEQKAHRQKKAAERYNRYKEKKTTTTT